MKLIGSGSIQIMLCVFVTQSRTQQKKVDSNIQNKQSQGKNSLPPSRVGALLAENYVTRSQCRGALSLTLLNGRLIFWLLTLETDPGTQSTAMEERRKYPNLPSTNQRIKILVYNFTNPMTMYKQHNVSLSTHLFCNKVTYHQICNIDILSSFHIFHKTQWSLTYIYSLAQLQFMCTPHNK